MEVGYSFDNILCFLWVEVVVVFCDGKYYDWGICIGVVFNIFGSFVIVEVNED